MDEETCPQTRKQQQKNTSFIGLAKRAGEPSKKKKKRIGLWYIYPSGEDRYDDDNAKGEEEENRMRIIIIIQ